MKKLIPGFILIMLSATALCQVKNSYEVSVSISGLRDSTIYLAYHFGDKQYVMDTVRLDSRGNGIFTGREILPRVFI